MIVLGIETSCDETSAAVVRGGRDVLSCVVASQHEIHAEFGGVVPELASRAHVEAISPTIDAALSRAGLAPRDVNAVAVGHRPGLIGSLLVGVTAAKAMAWSLGVPLVGVDHVHAHLYAGLLNNPVEPSVTTFPAIGLVVSGGHTSIYRVDAWNRLARLGATIDDAMGEAYDKAATILGLPHPGGPNLDRLARTPGANEHAEQFPISRLSPTSLDLSFSGLKTAMLYAVRGVPHTRGRTPPVPPAPLTDQRRADLAASFQRSACAAVLLKLERALDRTPEARTLLCGGGVTANSRLRDQLASLAQRRSLRLVIPPLDLCVDNAAMIAGLGSVLLDSGHRDTLALAPVPTTAC